MDSPRPADPAPPRAPFELAWRCLQCGELFPRGEGIPAACPHCQAPPTELELIEED